MANGFQYTLYEKRGHIAFMTLNRPEVMNAYHHAMLQGLADIWSDFRDDPEAWVAVLTGAGERAFCAGHDLKASGLEGYADPEPPSLHYGGIEIYKPIIGAINGYCLRGGGSMALGCDIRIAAANGVFGYPQPRYGLSLWAGTKGRLE